MPKLSQYFLRGGFICLAVGMLAGGLILVQKGTGRFPDLWVLLPAHIYLVLVGGVTQCAFGGELLDSTATFRRPASRRYSACVVKLLGAQCRYPSGGHASGDRSCLGIRCGWWGLRLRRHSTKCGRYSIHAARLATHSSLPSLAGLEHSPSTGGRTEKPGRHVTQFPCRYVALDLREEYWHQLCQAVLRRVPGTSARPPPSYLAPVKRPRAPGRTVAGSSCAGVFQNVIPPSAPGCQPLPPAKRQPARCACQFPLPLVLPGDPSKLPAVLRKKGCPRESSGTAAVPASRPPLSQAARMV